jgi:hypothetical protein
MNRKERLQSARTFIKKYSEGVPETPNPLFPEGSVILHVLASKESKPPGSLSGVAWAGHLPGGQGRCSTFPAQPSRFNAASTSF